LVFIEERIGRKRKEGVTSLVIVSNKERKKERKKESTKEKSEYQNSITYNEKQ